MFSIVQLISGPNNVKLLFKTYIIHNRLKVFCTTESDGQNITESSAYAKKINASGKKEQAITEQSGKFY